MFSNLPEFREVGEACGEHALSLVASLLNELAFSYVTFKAKHAAGAKKLYACTCF